MLVSAGCAHRELADSRSLLDWLPTGVNEWRAAAYFGFPASVFTLTAEKVLG